MAETKVEQVARAISIDLGEDPDARDVLILGRDGKRPHWEGFESTARAAIEAMRTPTEAMRRAGAAAMPVCFDEEAGAISCWQAMHDAILKEE